MRAFERSIWRKRTLRPSLGFPSRKLSLVESWDCTSLSWCLFARGRQGGSESIDSCPRIATVKNHGRKEGRKPQPVVLSRGLRRCGEEESAFYQGVTTRRVTRVLDARTVKESEEQKKCQRRNPQGKLVLLRLQAGGLSAFYSGTRVLFSKCRCPGLVSLHDRVLSSSRQPLTSRLLFSFMTEESSKKKDWRKEASGAQNKKRRKARSAETIGVFPKSSKGRERRKAIAILD